MEEETNHQLKIIGGIFRTRMVKRPTLAAELGDQEGGDGIEAEERRIGEKARCSSGLSPEQQAKTLVVLWT